MTTFGNAGSVVTSGLHFKIPFVQKVTKVNTTILGFPIGYRMSGDESATQEQIDDGITYVLPILIAVLSANKDAIVLIENPEAHLHPKGQAVLMELISKAVACGVQIVMESHSDHIIMVVWWQ